MKLALLSSLNSTRITAMGGVYLTAAYLDFCAKIRGRLRNLVQTHPEMFGVKIELPAPMTPEQPNLD